MHRFLKTAVGAALVLLLFAALFCGTVSANVIQISSDEWNALSSNPVSGEYHFTNSGTEPIKPKFLGENKFELTGDLTLDFDGFTGTFAGYPDGSGDKVGALFGYVSKTTVGQEVTLTIKNLTMTDAKISTSSGGSIGGIVGKFEGNSKDTCRLVFENCHLKNCTIFCGTGDFESHIDSIGGLVGLVGHATLTVNNCIVEYCDVVSDGNNIGGFVGTALECDATITNSKVLHCTVASTDWNNVGGIIGAASSVSFEKCEVEQTSVYSGIKPDQMSGFVGGLVGSAHTVSKIDKCSVKNCVVASRGMGVGGLLGIAGSSVGDISNSIVKSSTIMGMSPVGGLVGGTMSITSSSDNKLIDCAVHGNPNPYDSDEYSPIKTGLVCGVYINNLVSINCIQEGTNFINPGDPSDTISLYKYDEETDKKTPLPLGEPDFWKLISYTTANREDVTTPITELGNYGEDGGYGFGLKSVNSYSVTVTVNPKDSGSITHQSGTTVFPDKKVKISATANTGYTFTEWRSSDVTITNSTSATGASFTMPAQDVTITAEFTAKTYTVTLDPKGGIGGTTSVTATYGAAMPTEGVTMPTKTGYAFKGYFDAQTGGTQYYNADGTSAKNWDKDSDSETLYAHWEETAVPITLSTASAGNYVYGETPSKPSLSPSVEGAEFYYSDSAAVPHTDNKKWNDLKSSTLNAGTYYVYAKVGNDESKPGTFKVTKAEQGKPQINAEATDGCIKVTVGDGSVVKSYEYQYVEGSSISPSKDKWNPASGNEIKITGLTPNQQYTIAVRATENINYNPSEAETVTKTAPAVFSVTYNANGGTGGITENSVNGKVTLKPTSIVKRDGYTVEENWYTDPTGGNPVSGTVQTGMIVYAHWKANPYTIKFDANGGSGSMASQRLYYGATEATPLTANSFTKTDYSFAGWAVTQEGAEKRAVIYTDKQEVQNLGDITLYAVWVKNEEKHTITITLAEPANVKLMRGTAQICDMSGPTISFENLPSGTYNLVATNEAGKTVTSIVILGTEDKDVPITFPEANVNSKVEVSKKQNTPAVVVGKLDEEAEAKAEDGRKVTITLAVEAKVEAEVAETESTDVKKVQDEISKIKTKVKSEDSKVAENPMQFLEITVKKKVDDTPEELIPETSKVIELVVPYDFTNKIDVKVYRIHNGEYQALEKNGSGNDRTYKTDETNGLLYIYASKFSLYSIGFTTKSEPQPVPPEQPSHSSRDYGASIWLPATAEPTAAPTAEPEGQTIPTVTPVKTPTQAPATPAPFIGLLAGLGAAAVFFGLKRK